jgi:hypothetical protein
MNVLQSLFSFRSARTVQQLTVEIAGRSWPRIWQRVAHRAPQMTTAEARGYVRAHSASVVQELVAAALRSRPSLPASLADVLVERVTDLVLAQSAAEIQRMRRAVPLRRAA